jgi:predicted dehydrogenase
MISGMNRREFIQQAAAGAAILSSAGGLSAQAAPGKLKVAIIGRTGRGNYGHNLDVAWAHPDDVQIVAIADENEAGRNQAAERLSVTRRYADYREMLAKEKPHIVCVAPRWPDCHREMAVACAEAGCHVLLEKPMCRSLDEADEMVAAFEKRGLKLAMAHQTRYSPTLDKIREFIAAGKLGEVVEIRGRGKEDHRGGGEDLMVLGVHIMDLMRALAGDPLWCSARVLADGKLVTREHVKDGNEGIGLIAGDEIHASYRFDKGVMGYFSTRRSKDGAGARYGVQIFGTKGVMAMTMSALPTVKLLESVTWTAEPGGPGWTVFASTTEPEPAKEAFGNRLIVDDLMRAIRTGAQPKCGVRDGRWTIEMIMAAYESHRLNKPVDLPLENRKHPLTRIQSSSPVQ